MWNTRNVERNVPIVYVAPSIWNVALLHFLNSLKLNGAFPMSTNIEAGVVVGGADGGDDGSCGGGCCGGKDGCRVVGTAGAFGLRQLVVSVSLMDDSDDSGGGRCWRCRGGGNGGGERFAGAETTRPDAASSGTTFGWMTGAELMLSVTAVGCWCDGGRRGCRGGFDDGCSSGVS